jgi:hypothetical protein
LPAAAAALAHAAASLIRDDGAAQSLLPLAPHVYAPAQRGLLRSRPSWRGTQGYSKGTQTAPHRPSCRWSAPTSAQPSARPYLQGPLEYYKYYYYYYYHYYYCYYHYYYHYYCCCCCYYCYHDYYYCYYYCYYCHYYYYKYPL